MSQKVSVPGYSEEDLAHLSNKQRERLRDELTAGAKASQKHADALEYNKKQIEKHGDQQSALATELDPEAITAARIAEQRLAATRAQEQQSLNAAANATKEASDFNESMQGRQVVSATVSEHVADAAVDLARGRTEQAEEGMLTQGNGFNGHPGNSEAQRDAALANSEKEIADRAQAGNYQNEQVYQGHNQETVAVTRQPAFDDNGALKGYYVNGVFEPDEDYEAPAHEVDQAQTNNQTAQTTGETTAHQPQTGGSTEELPSGQLPGTEPNGQVQNAGEPNANEVMLAGLGEDNPSPRKKGRQKPTSGNAVGDGPKSE